MPYSYKRIDKFIRKVNKLADAAAQKVYDQHQPELERMIMDQLKPGDRLFIGMGSASLDDVNVAEKFCNIIARTQYGGEDLDANFCLNDFNKPLL